MNSMYPHIGMLTQAKSFLSAAKYLDEASRTRFEGQAYPHVDVNVYDVFCYLCMHAVELALKSILILNGFNEKRLRRLGHDLLKIWDEVSKCEGFCTEAILNENLRFVVEWLNPDYMTKQMEYFAGERYVQRPLSDPLLEITSNLVSELNDQYRVLLRQSLTNQEK